MHPDSTSHSTLDLTSNVPPRPLIRRRQSLLDRARGALSTKGGGGGGGQGMTLTRRTSFLERGGRPVVRTLSKIGRR